MAISSFRPPATPLVAVAALPTCRIGLRIQPDGLIEEIVFMPPEGEIETVEIAHPFLEQLDAYLTDPRSAFSLPLAPHGTPFQNRVWQAISTIPCGATRNYGAISTELASSPRAVGQACGANPFPLVVPCHRVLARASIGGFAHNQQGWLIDTKRWLLRHEMAV